MTKQQTLLYLEESMEQLSNLQYSSTSAQATNILTEVIDVLSNAEQSLSSINEAVKPHVPKFVGTWYEDNKYRLSNSLWEFTIATQEKTTSPEDVSYTEFESWFIDTIDAYEILVNMKNGYTTYERRRVVAVGKMFLKAPVATNVITAAILTFDESQAYEFTKEADAGHQISVIGEGHTKFVNITN